jgi:hypothetical protein
MIAVLQAAIAKLATVQQQREALQKSVPAAAHAAITGDSPSDFLKQCFKKALQQFLRVTRAAATEPQINLAQVGACITAVKESVEFGDSSAHLQNAARIVQKHVYG